MKKRKEINKPVPSGFIPYMYLFKTLRYQKNVSSYVNITTHSYDINVPDEVSNSG